MKLYSVFILTYVLSEYNVLSHASQKCDVTLWHMSVMDHLLVQQAEMTPRQRSTLEKVEHLIERVMKDGASPLINCALLNTYSYNLVPDVSSKVMDLIVKDSEGRADKAHINGDKVGVDKSSDKDGVDTGSDKYGPSTNIKETDINTNSNMRAINANRGVDSIDAKKNGSVLLGREKTDDENLDNSNDDDDDNEDCFHNGIDFICAGSNRHDESVHHSALDSYAENDSKDIHDKNADKNSHEVNDNTDGDDRNSREVKDNTDGDDRNSREVKDNTDGDDRNSREVNDNTDGDDRNSREVKDNTDGDDRNSREVKDNTDGDDRNSREVKDNTDGDDRNSREVKDNTDGDDRNSREVNDNTDGDDRNSREVKDNTDGDDRNSREVKDNTDGDERNSREVKNKNTDDDDRNSREVKDNIDGDERNSREVKDNIDGDERNSREAKNKNTDDDDKNSGEIKDSNNDDDNRIKRKVQANNADRDDDNSSDVQYENTNQSDKNLQSVHVQKTLMSVDGLAVQERFDNDNSIASKTLQNKNDSENAETTEDNSDNIRNTKTNDYMGGVVIFYDDESKDENDDDETSYKLKNNKNELDTEKSKNREEIKEHEIGEKIDNFHLFVPKNDDNIVNNTDKKMRADRDSDRYDKESDNGSDKEFNSNERSANKKKSQMDKQNNNERKTLNNAESKSSYKNENKYLTYNNIANEIGEEKKKVDCTTHVNMNDEMNKNVKESILKQKTCDHSNSNDDPNLKVEKIKEIFSQRQKEQADKIQNLELLLVKLENKILTQSVETHRDSNAFIHLENQILKLENELMKLSHNYRKLQDDYDSVKAQQKKSYLELEHFKTTPRKSEYIAVSDNSSYEIMMKQQARISELSQLIQSQSDVAEKLQSKSEYLEDQNRKLFQVLMNQTSLIASIMSKLYELGDERLQSKIQAEDFKAKLEQLKQFQLMHQPLSQEKMQQDKKVQQEAVGVFDFASDSSEKIFSPKVSANPVTKNLSTDLVTRILSVIKNLPTAESPSMMGFQKWNCDGLNSTRLCIYHSLIVANCTPFNNIEWNLCKPVKDSLFLESNHKRIRRSVAVIGGEDTRLVRPDMEDKELTKSHNEKKRPIKSGDVDQGLIKSGDEDKDISKSDDEEKREVKISKSLDYYPTPFQNGLRLDGVNENENDEIRTKVNNIDRNDFIKSKITVSECENSETCQQSSEDKNIPTPDNERGSKDTRHQSLLPDTGQLSSLSDINKISSCERHGEYLNCGNNARTKTSQVGVRTASLHFDGESNEQNKESNQQNPNLKHKSQSTGNTVKAVQEKRLSDLERKMAAGEAMKMHEALHRKVLYNPVHKDRSMDCYELNKRGQKRNGFSQIFVNGFNDYVSVNCDMTSGGWTFLLKREDGLVNFYRDYAQYKQGFGASTGEHYIGNDVIHYLTNQGHYSLKVELTDWNGTTKLAHYDHFWLDGDEDGFRLHLLGYSGDAGDGLGKHNGMKFSTFDFDQDLLKYEMGGSCAKRFHGAWWYYNCYASNLLGRYYSGGQVPNKQFDGVAWKPWLGPGYSLKTVVLAVRPFRVE